MLRIMLALLIVCGLTFSVAFAETRIFDFRHRNPADVAETVRMTLSGSATVTAIDHSLVVSADPQQMTAVAELVARLDRAPRMLRVIVAQGHNQVDNDNSVAAAGRVPVGSGTIVVGQSGNQTHGGTAIILGDDDKLRVRAGSSTRNDLQRAEQFVVTLEGSPARISIGRRIPFAERWVELARRHVQTVESIRYESVDTGFEVEPELFGDMVQLIIHPYLAFQDRYRSKEIRFLDLTTRVNVPLGRWFDLGGAVAVRDEVSREILAAGNTSGTESGNIRVRVELHQD
jgi:hypothetical protein